MRAFPVVLPSGTRYWTVLDDDLLVVPVADSWGRYQRFGRSRADLTTRTNAGGVNGLLIVPAGGREASPQVDDMIAPLATLACSSSG